MHECGVTQDDDTASAQVESSAMLLSVAVGAAVAVVVATEALLW